MDVIFIWNICWHINETWCKCHKRDRRSSSYQEVNAERPNAKSGTFVYGHNMVRNYKLFHKRKEYVSKSLLKFLPKVDLFVYIKD